MSIRSLIFAVVISTVSVGSVESAEWFGGPVQVFGGYSYLKFEPGGDLESINLHGIHFEATVMKKSWLGLVVDLAAFRGTADLPQASMGKLDLNQYHLAAGPRVVRNWTRWFRSSFRLLVGVADGVADARGTVNGGPRVVDIDQSSPIIIFGGSFDILVSKAARIRIAQPNYQITQFGDDTQKSWRFSAGLTFDL